MNDSELESKLKTVRAPVRSEDYWENFSSQVRARLRSAPAELAPRNFWLPRLAWSGGFAVACLVFSFSLLPAYHALLKNETTLRRELAELPNHLRKLMANEHGLHYLVEEKE